MIFAATWCVFWALSAPRMSLRSGLPLIPAGGAYSSPQTRPPTWWGGGSLPLSKNPPRFRPTASTWPPFWNIFPRHRTLYIRRVSWLKWTWPFFVCHLSTLVPCQLVSEHSAWEVIFYNEMRYINLRFTYLLTYLLTKMCVMWIEFALRVCLHNGALVIAFMVML